MRRGSKRPEHPEHDCAKKLEAAPFGASSGAQMFRRYRNMPEHDFFRIGCRPSGTKAAAVFR